MLSEEIENTQRLVRTDAYQMSIGEIVSMHENEEIVIDPEFQRLFRWDIGQIKINRVPSSWYTNTIYLCV
ncbi:hypothetical protein [Acuticoccus kandeliae]|uniref:hypothetical protein n=1 Tax=Acuticoccus kandeliae TaxID=2073160 RepID=UPI00196B327F|nr:hypothetical protein [Acuticoccus kandeliae]